MNGSAGFRVRRRIEFADTDASGRAHFAAVLRHVEAAEHECLRQAEVPVGDEDGAWPRVRVECEFMLPLAFGDEVTVVLRTAPGGKTSLAWEFEVQQEGEHVARGTVVTVLVDAGGRPRAVPDEWRQRLRRVTNP
jgi:acyl-CoA thioester hydrolase